MGLNGKALLAEFIGTFALIFIGVATIAGHVASGGGTGLTGIALAHGLTIATMVTATAAISGGHLNPAVTVGAFLAKKIDLANGIGYVIAQCLGGVFAASMVKLALPADWLTPGMGTPALGEGISPLNGVAMEFFLTFFLVFVIFGSAIDTRAPKMGGLFIGLTVALDILAGGNVSGAAMNPARHLGPALINGVLGPDIWIYWVGPILGGAAAALVYHNLFEVKG